MPQFRQIVRNLSKAPVTMGIAVLSLALGIGANTAMFSALNQILWRTLPVPEPQRIALLYHPGPLQGSVSSDEDGGPVFSYPVYRELARQQTSFTGLAAGRTFGASLTASGHPQLQRRECPQVIGELVRHGRHADIVAALLEMRGRAAEREVWVNLEDRNAPAGPHDSARFRQRARQVFHVLEAQREQRRIERAASHGQPGHIVTQ